MIWLQEPSRKSTELSSIRAVETLPTMSETPCSFILILTTPTQLVWSTGSVRQTVLAMELNSRRTQWAHRSPLPTHGTRLTTSSSQLSNPSGSQVPEREQYYPIQSLTRLPRRMSRGI